MIKAFLKDQVRDFIGYTCITILILFYYYLEFGSGVKIIYPILLALFVVSVITSLKGIHYVRFNNALKKDYYKGHLLKGATYQELQVIETIQELHQYYHSEIGKLTKQKEEADTFITQMAHDLKIPVSVILLILEASGEQPLSIEHSQKIKVESDKLVDKLSQLISYLRMGQFEKDYRIEKVNLIDEIRGAINKKKDYFILNKMFPRFQMPKEEIYVLTDQKWHGMLLDQIISNSIKYSALKGKEGYIDFDVIYMDKSVELTITDYGIGIPNYDMERIFKPFFTGENGRKTSNSSGIGLYLCLKISKKLGHQLSISSVRGEKTVVTIRYLSNL